MATSWMSVPAAKSVLVFRNGDPFHTGQRLLLRPRAGATLEAFLNEVTQSIGAAVAVRALHTPRHGHRVRDLQELRPRGAYVATGVEKFKKLDYLNTGARRPEAGRGAAGPQVQPPQRPSVSARWRKAVHLPCVVHVFRNGDVLAPPLRLLIPRSLQRDLEQVLGLLTEKTDLRTGAVRRLCTLEGGTVSSVDELVSGQYYVAVGTEKFKKLPYVEMLVQKAPGAGLRNHPRSRKLPQHRQTRKPVSVPQDRYSDSALLVSPEGDSRRVRSTGDEAEGGGPREGRSPKKEESLFYAKPMRVHKNRAGSRVPAAKGGQAQSSVFNGAVRKRREETQGAQQVAEDEDTAVELPLDQRVSETVEDEALGEDDGRASPKDHRPQQLATQNWRTQSSRSDLQSDHIEGANSPGLQTTRKEETNFHGSRPTSRTSGSSLTHQEVKYN
ncbi:doublecortin domain-containing protein 2B isoform X3 [Paramormyrops kingsleyae]|uniref:doublecortin domain-containing protein 2B isoform X3 n=1 Tax=Paramormyrops kingsleyae TaxID=1676925 RepID=UPI000CD6404E|nr:doublecortin domain-containing protein 2B isoform X3 [Paramormyrops kingsleyae]